MLGTGYSPRLQAWGVASLLGFCRQETDTAANIRPWNQSPPGLPPLQCGLAVYVGPYFALLLPSELMQIFLNPIDAWNTKQDRLLMVLRHRESGGQNWCSWARRRGPSFPCRGQRAALAPGSVLLFCATPAPQGAGSSVRLTPASLGWSTGYWPGLKAGE